MSEQIEKLKAELDITSINLKTSIRVEESQREQIEKLKGQIKDLRSACEQKQEIIESLEKELGYDWNKLLTKKK